MSFHMSSCNEDGNVTDFGSTTSLSSSSSMSDVEDFEYQQALETLEQLRKSPVHQQSRSISRQQLRKRESIMCLQDLVQVDDSDNHSRLRQMEDHVDSNGWGFFMEAKRSKPPLGRPFAGLRRSPQSSVSRTLNLPRMPSISDKTTC
ncbi:hypothetical protein MPSEU_000048300 [Mayamaea pseudoterrestris]|nr:hypothetical protein MPSEU_000048300 [Mayamaea pseudoterrestris]